MNLLPWLFPCPKQMHKYLPGIPSLFYVMKHVNHVPNSSRAFFDFCCEKNTCHGVYLQFKFMKAIGSA